MNNLALTYRMQNYQFISAYAYKHEEEIKNFIYGFNIGKFKTTYYPESKNRRFVIAQLYNYTKNNCFKRSIFANAIIEDKLKSLTVNLTVVPTRQHRYCQH